MLFHMRRLADRMGMVAAGIKPAAMETLGRCGS
jgi:hypothetical protein